jgi:glyoxylase-like metal-dependent hydrolase (beta-lactamase superfamily II)
VGTTPPAGSEEQLGSEPRLLRSHDILCVRAPNQGPYTLSGTNSWLVARAPTWLIDPGPLEAEHVRRLRVAIEARGGLGGIALTHEHRDHSAAARELLAEHRVPLAAARGETDVTLVEGARFGPLEAVYTPGHAPDHFAFIAAGACFSGDAVLGEGSVFISPHDDALVGYLEALERLRAREDFSVICPGHGPVAWDARAKLEQYIEHRLERERDLVRALARGLRGVRELLDAVWGEVPAALRPAAEATLAAHLDKLEREGELPDGVERPAVGQGAP